MVIVCSVHQPSQKLFDMFDRVYVLSLYGKCAFEAPPGEAIRRLEECGFCVPRNNSVAEFLAEVASGEHGDDKLQYLTKKVSIEQDDPLRRLVKPGQFRTVIELAVEPHPPSGWNNFATLIRRTFLLSVRQRTLFYTRLFSPIVIALMASYLFGDIGRYALGAVHSLTLVF